jgi:hypothetical protein
MPLYTMKIYRLLVLGLLLVFPVVLRAQREPDARLFVAGFQFRPLVPSKFFGAGGVENTDRNLHVNIKPRLGYTFGMILRRGFTPTFSIETGINYWRRNFTMTNRDDSLKFTDVSTFGIVSYEIPVQALFYVRLSKQIYMNVSGGTSFNWFASDVFSKGKNLAFTQYTEISLGWVKMALLANLGWEWRTEKSGFFYLGASLHRPLFPIGTTTVSYDQGYWKYNTELELTGSALTLDFRYFFHAVPVKKREKSTKKNNRD